MKKNWKLQGISNTNIMENEQNWNDFFMRNYIFVFNCKRTLFGVLGMALQGTQILIGLIGLLQRW
jgi:hypothetical protein